MYNRVVNKLHFLRDRYLLRLPPRAENPYVTHFPVLLAIGQSVPIVSVLEFGSGDSSTKGFLDKSCFPSLARLESYENDPVWAARMREQLGGDARLNINLVDGPIHRAVQAIDLEVFDLILIDDSRSIEDRSATIRAVAAKCPQRALVVIHDFENRQYREAAHKFRKRCRLVGQSPNIGVAWNGSQLKYSVLQGFDRRLRALGERGGIEEWASELGALRLH